MCSVTSFLTSLIDSYIFSELMFFQVKNVCNLYKYFIIEMKNTKYAFHLLLCAANKLKLILIINEVTIELPILSWWIYEQCSSAKPLMFVSCNVSISQFLCFMHQLKKLSTEWFVNPYWQWWICVNLVSMATVNTCQTSSVIYHLLGTGVILRKGLICLSVLKHCVLSSSLLEASCATLTNF